MQPAEDIVCRTILLPGMQLSRQSMRGHEFAMRRHVAG